MRDQLARDLLRHLARRDEPPVRAPDDPHDRPQQTVQPPVLAVIDGAQRTV
ncbi:hypothetical protein [Streptomyces sp. MAA16]|uniref:hypothetical protein n=1 Tax=Streptomyces sp. MAA16 TaxID=3035116 RepID=UPI0024756A95|nr:hypothetical protein [Streptomyces sp. MAA16]MDH6700829.1 hypothetical protein [Streptomyces sp. MAA16]